MNPLVNDKIKLINAIYQDFLSKVRDIELERDKKVADLFEGFNQQEIERILASIKDKGNDNPTS